MDVGKKTGGAMLVKSSSRKYLMECIFLRLEERQDEFLHLEQGELTVIDYEKRFIELAKYAMMVVATERDRCRCFKTRLRPEIRIPIIALAS